MKRADPASAAPIPRSALQLLPAGARIAPRLSGRGDAFARSDGDPLLAPGPAVSRDPSTGLMASSGRFLVRGPVRPSVRVRLRRFFGIDLRSRRSLHRAGVESRKGLQPFDRLDSNDRMRRDDRIGVVAGGSGQETFAC